MQTEQADKGKRVTSLCTGDMQVAMYQAGGKFTHVLTEDRRAFHLARQRHYCTARLKTRGPQAGRQAGCSRQG